MQTRLDGAVTVYSKPNCPQCTMTYRFLDQKNISYRSVDVTQDADALSYARGLGYSSAPVVVIDSARHWSGFRPEKLIELLDSLEAA